MTVPAITPARLVAAVGCHPDVASRVAKPLQEACEKWGIDSPIRVAAFVAQTAFESQGFTRGVENLNYFSAQRLCEVWPSRFRMPFDMEAGQEILADGRRNPSFYTQRPLELADYVYANRMGNGSEASRDGSKFIGRGFIQITGRANYAEYEKAAHVPVTTSPELMVDTAIAADSAAWFWISRGCNPLADQSAWQGLTRVINGGFNGLDKRRAMTAVALSYFVQGA